jgi:hypothetical protein
MRGLGTAGRCFGCERYCCLQTSVTIDLGRIAFVAHRFSADWFTHRANIRLHRPAKHLGLPRYMVASDQHQPDNSRATATLATKGFFFRSVKPCHLL